MYTDFHRFSRILDINVTKNPCLSCGNPLGAVYRYFRSDRLLDQGNEFR
jgi:DNA-directed RNA polymerase subunit N (RpoN/RPB10)